METYPSTSKQSNGITHDNGINGCNSNYTPMVKKKESIIDLKKFLEKPVRVKFIGGREAIGILNACDPLLNLILDNTKEFIRDSNDPATLTEETRDLGLVVCRGPSVSLVCPLDGMEPVMNPFTK